MFDEGTGPPVVVIPGIQGRWEWMRPALGELRKRCRTISYSLCGDIGSGVKIDPSLGFDNYLRQLDRVLDEAGIDRAALCGVSYGGLVALRYAATRPDRVSALIFASSPAPGWTPTDQQRRYIERPWLSAPAFVATSPGRLWPEIVAARGSTVEGLMFSARHLARVLAAPMIPSLMASRVTLQQGLDFAADCARVVAPTLVITGEEHLDRVVPVRVTRGYESVIHGARYQMLERTGHVGLVTRPAEFANVVTGFVHAHSH
jgi:3-oxoadipate enol-lactonase